MNSGGYSTPSPLAYILCGGQGTRLRGVIGDTQKAIAEIRGQPFIALLLRELRAGYRADQLLAMAGTCSIPVRRNPWKPSKRISHEEH
jgi:2-C-methyl-D-erythritol 4-phosphate cytidylyltransferase